jgi:hypothetical protein
MAKKPHRAMAYIGSGNPDAFSNRFQAFVYNPLKNND